MLDFHYMELLKANLKGTYFRKDGIEVYNKSAVEISVWLSMDRRNVCTIHRFYGTYKVSEC